MKQSLTLPFALLALVLLGSVAFWVTSTTNKSFTNTPAATISAISPTPYTFTRTLTRGDSGADVKMLEEYLKYWAYFKRSTDTAYDRNTARSVELFQGAHGLSKTGSVDAATLPVLNAKVAALYTTPPAITITASPTSVAYNGTSTITWNTTNASACSLNTGQSGTRGSFVTPPLTTATTYTLSCTGTGGSASQGVMVSVTSGTTWKTVAQEGGTFTVPVATLTRYGEQTAWIEKTVTGTVTCSNEFYGFDPLPNVVKSCQIPSTAATSTNPVPPTNGSCGGANGTTVSTAPTTNLCSSGTASAVTGSGPWTWQCLGTNGGTTASCSASLATVPPPTATFTANPTTITQGQSSTLTWTSSGATSCDLSSGQSGTAGTTIVTPSLTTTYTLTCTGSGGAVTRTVTVTVSAPPSTGEGNWSDPLTWGGTVPTLNQAITIPLGKTVVLDVTPPRLASLSIDGTLRFARKPLNLTTGFITIGRTGLLEVGTETSPFTDKVVITLDGAKTGAATDRGIVVNGGRLELHGVAPSPVWTKLNDHAEAAATSLTLKDNTNWKSGDTVVVAPTEWPNPNSAFQYSTGDSTELRTLASAGNNTVSLTAGLSQYHFGRLQYATDQGMSYTKGTLTKPNALNVDTLDERAEVGNLSRNIVIQAPDDSLWQTSGFGAHIMVMVLGAQVKLDGVELTRMGQSGILGRYPIHWHLMSYDQATGNLLGDATGNYVKNSAIYDSKHRCVVLHATNGVQVQNNICYNVTGHAFFLEDGSERRNIFEGNLSLKTLNIPTALATQVHETDNSCGGGTAGYWITNPDNTFKNNVGADSAGSGFWLSYATTPMKQSKLVPISPASMDHAPFEDNVAHSNRNSGLLLECGMTDDLGNVTNSKYRPPTPVDLVRITSYKNGGGGYGNRVTQANYLNWAVADNIGGGFSGAIDRGYIMHTLLVGQSLNNRVAYDSVYYAWRGPQFGITSYHSTMNNVENIFVNFKNVGYARPDNGWDFNSGSLGTNDYYTAPLERGLARSPGNKFINADPGYRALPPFLQPNWTLAAKNNWALAGAIQDPYGYWSTPGYYSVYDVSFLKMLGCSPIYSVNPVGRQNGVSCPGPYYGVLPAKANRGLVGETRDYIFMETLDVTRVDQNNATVGTWRIEAGHDSNFLGGMRHFAAAKGSDRYIVRFPDFPATSTVKSAPKWLQMNFSNFVRTNDSLVLGLHYDGATTPAMVYVSTSGDYPNFDGSQPNSKLLTPVSSLTEVQNGNGLVYFQDKAQNLVWVKMINYNFPLNIYIPDYLDPNSDHQLYREFALRISNTTATR